MRNYLLIFSIFIFTSEDLYSDSFKYNSFNNHGVIGLINMPSARFYDEASHGITIYDGTPDQKITMTSFPYDWMEASFFYTNIQGMEYPGFEYQDYKDKGLVVLGFPCNQFAGQEPETNDTIVETCKINHGVTFQLTEKVDVNGANTHPIFKHLKKEKGGFLLPKIKWNFTKFLVNKEGEVVKRYAPTTTPDKIAGDIEKAL